MNHRKSRRRLNRTTAHRKAMQRNLVQSLFEHGEVRTTLPKAKDLRPFAERLITLAKRARGGNLNARRRIHSLMADRSLIPADHRETYEGLPDAKRRQVLTARSGRRHRAGVAKGRLEFTAESVTHRLIETIAPRFEDRPGGYTRIVRIADRRIGDQSQLAVVQLVGEEESPGSVPRPRKSARRVRTDARYAAAIKASKSAARGERGVVAARTEEAEEPATPEDEQAEEATAEAPPAEEAETGDTQSDEKEEK